MATFDESQITDLAEILGTNSSELDVHLDFFASVITDSDKTAVLSRVTNYQAIEDKVTSFSPNVKNFGAVKNPANQRALIKNRIAGLIHWASVSGSGLVRG